MILILFDLIWFTCHKYLIVQLGSLWCFWYKNNTWFNLLITASHSSSLARYLQTRKVQWPLSRRPTRAPFPKRIIILKLNMISINKYELTLRMLFRNRVKIRYFEDDHSIIMKTDTFSSKYRTLKLDLLSTITLSSKWHGDWLQVMTVSQKKSERPVWWGK